MKQRVVSETHPKTKLWNACVGLVFIISVIGVLLLVFETLPKRENERQSIPQILADIAAPVMQKTPSWLGLWNVETPSGVFLPGFPSSETIVSEARTMVPLLEDLKSHKFFRYFKVDLSRECPFWAREEMCTSPNGECSVCECSEDQIPTAWKEKPIEHFVDRSHYVAEEVSPWNEASFKPTRSYGDVEGEFLNFMSGEASGGHSTYVDLTLNRPGFTEYRGRNIWSLIYKENCIRDDMSSNSTDVPDVLGTCREEEMFEKLISGLQTCIMVLASEYNEPIYSRWPLMFSSSSFKYHNKLLPPHMTTSDSSTTGSDSGIPNRYRYSLDLFRWRVAPHKQWIENLYVTFSVLLKSLCKLGTIIESCPCITSTDHLEDDKLSKLQLQSVLNKAKKLTSCAQVVKEQPLFQTKHELAIQQFHNISRILDCVECEKCRLHGKVKFTALQVALKASGATPLLSLERNEIIALINSLGYFGEAVLIIDSMKRRQMALRRMTLCYASSLLLIVTGVILFFKHRRNNNAALLEYYDEVSITEATDSKAKSD